MEELYKKRALCVHENCKMADVCLRAKGFKSVTDDDKEFPIVNPIVVTQDADCPYLATLVVVRYAQGFKKILDNIPAGVSNRIYHQISSNFGKNPYYDRRSGKKLISPSEQEFIRNIFLSHDITDEVFDGYVDVEEWNG